MIMQDQGGTEMSEFRIRFGSAAEDESDVVADVREMGAKFLLGPGEKEGKLEVVKVSGGITNLLYRVSKRESEATDALSSVLVRIYGPNTEVLIDREVECKLFGELSRLGFGPPLLGVFRNGRVEGFLAGSRPLQPEEMGDTGDGGANRTNFVALIASEMARMHSLSVKTLDGRVQIWDNLDKWLHIARSLSFEGEPEKQEAYSKLELEGYREILSNVRRKLDFSGSGPRHEVPFQPSPAEIFMSAAVFVHGDLLGGNILHLPSQKRVQFIDFEYSSYAPRGLDFANHWNEYAGFDSDFEGKYPSSKTQCEFMESYIKNAKPDLITDGTISIQTYAMLQTVIQSYRTCTGASGLLFKRSIPQSILIF